MFAVLLGLIGSIALGGTLASAHTALESSNPADGSTLDRRPTEISFEFAEPLLPDFVKFVAIDDAGTTSELTVKSVDGPNAVLDWPAEFAAGTWTVEYRVVSEDGHPVNGSISFSYTAPTPSPTAPGPSTSNATSSSAVPTSSSVPAPSTSSAAPSPAGSTASPSASPASSSTSGNLGWVIAGVAVLALAAVAIAGLIARNRSQ